MSRRYVECGHCGKKIYEGETVVNHINCGIYCSPTCYLEDQVPYYKTELNEYLVEDCRTEWKED